MKENLKTTRLNDGTSLLLNKNNFASDNDTIPEFFTYNNTTNTDTINAYGKLYNGYAVLTTKLCPTGWIVPSESQYSTLFENLGGTKLAGGSLKDTGSIYWKYPNIGATNITGFSALPSGYRRNDGTFFDIGTDLYLLTSTISFPKFIYVFSINFGYAKIFTSAYTLMQGLSVRCIKDSLENNIEKIDRNDILKIFPNPTSDKLTIDCTEKINNLYIYNLLGELVFRQQLNNGFNEINVSNLQTGIYVIKLENEQGTIQQKLIKK